MSRLKLCRTIVVAYAMFGFDPAFAQQPDVDPAMMCDAAAAAYQSYAATTTIPTRLMLPLE